MKTRLLAPKQLRGSDAICGAVALLLLFTTWSVCKRASNTVSAGITGCRPARVGRRMRAVVGRGWLVPFLAPSDAAWATFPIYPTQPPAAIAIAAAATDPLPGLPSKKGREGRDE